jgi:hypothetical protein
MQQDDGRALAALQPSRSDPADRGVPFVCLHDLDLLGRPLR